MKSSTLNIVLIGIILVLVGLGVFFYIQNQKNTTAGPSSISGTFNINGVIPENSTITLSSRNAHNQKAEFKSFSTNITPKDNSEWTFNGVTTGTSYEIQAEVMSSDNKILYRSDPITVTAPATEEKITLNIPAEDSPEQSAIISATIGINGYIPQGATLTIEARKEGVAEYTVVAQGLPGKDNQYMSYASALAGRTYEIRGILYNSAGTQIGTSSVITVTAPAENEKLDINSTAQPPVTPAPTASPQATAIPVQNGIISGTINFNGAALPNSRIVVFQQQTGSGNYQVAVDNIVPQNGSTWSWNGAKVGASYTLIAILKQHNSNGTDTDISDSSSITVTAPAANEVFTINSGYSLSAPGGPITLTCGNQNGSVFNVSVAFQSVTNAQSYWFQIGTSNGGVQLTNFTQNATNNPTQASNFTFQAGTPYYARYAYANVPNLGAGSSQFSPFSSTTQFQCP